MFALRPILLMLALSGLIFAAPTHAQTAPPAQQDPAPKAADGLVPSAVDLPSRPALMLNATSDWDGAETALSEAINRLYASAKKAGLEPAGPPLVEYLESGDEEFKFDAFLPLAAAPPAGDYGKDVGIGATPGGRALKFTHQGSFEDLEDVYNRIDDYLAGKNLEMKRVFEEYASDPANARPDEMTTNIYVVTE